MYSDLFVDPDAFFRREAESVSTVPPLAVVVVAALTAAFIPLVVLYFLAEITARGVGSYVWLFGSVGVVGGMLSVVGMWMVAALCMHFVGFYLGGRGSLRGTVLVAGWGFLPLILTNVVNAFFIYRIVSGAIAQAGAEAVTPRYLTTVLTGHPMLLVAKVVSLVGILWMAFLWTFAVKNIHDLDLGQSAVAVTVPTVAILAYWVLRGF